MNKAKRDIPKSEDQCFSDEEWLWIKPLKEIFKKHQVKCSYGSLGLMVDIHNFYFDYFKQETKDGDKR